MQTRTHSSQQLEKRRASGRPPSGSRKGPAWARRRQPANPVQDHSSQSELFSNAFDNQFDEFLRGRTTAKRWWP